jgi:hypothetical protein
MKKGPQRNQDADMSGAAAPDQEVNGNVNGPTDPNKNLSFGKAIDAAKDGKLIARSGWNGKGMFVFMRPSDHLEPSFIIEKVKSLPQAFKNTLIGVTFREGETIKFGSYLCMKAADNSIVNGWLASQTDMLANDWEIVGE